MISGSSQEADGKVPREYDYYKYMAIIMAFTMNGTVQLRGSCEMRFHFRFEGAHRTIVVPPIHYMMMTMMIPYIQHRINGWACDEIIQLISPPFRRPSSEYNWGSEPPNLVCQLIINTFNERHCIISKDVEIPAKFRREIMSNKSDVIR